MRQRAESVKESPSMLSVIGEKNPHNITCDNRKGFTGWTQMLYVEEESVFDLLEEKKRRKNVPSK